MAFERIEIENIGGSRLESDMNGHGHDFGHEFVSESVSESDTDTRFLGTADTDSNMDSDEVMISDTDTTLDTGKSENLGHGHEHTSIYIFMLN